jgi:hypothetical protein
MAVLLTISTAFISIVLTAVVFSGEDRIIDLSERELVEPEPLDGVRIRSISVRTAEDVLGLSREPAGRDILLMRVSGELEHAVEAAARRLKGTHHLKRLDSGLYMLRPQCIAAHD